MRKPSPSIVMSTLALVVALGSGTAYAASALAKNSVGTKQLRDGAVTTAKVKDGTLAVVDLAPDARAALRGATGAQGERGPQGVPGERGPAGQAGALGTMTMRYSGSGWNPVDNTPGFAGFGDSGRVRPTGSAVLARMTLPGPQVVAGIGYTLSSVTWCINGATGDTVVTRMAVVRETAGNQTGFVSDDTSHAAAGCFTIDPSGISSPTDRGYGLLATVTGSSGEVLLLSATAEWTPAA